MIGTAIWALRAVNWANWIVAGLFTLLLAALLSAPDLFRDGFAEVLDGARSVNAALLWIKLFCVIVVPVAIAAHVIFTRLVAMLRDTQAGRAFTEVNARRLATIAWALLAINVADLIFGQVSVWASETSGEYFGWSPALTGWLAVPLLLILARIFKEGAAMREDLEGTV